MEIGKGRRKSEGEITKEKWRERNREDKLKNGKIVKKSKGRNQKVGSTWQNSSKQKEHITWKQKM